MGKTLLGPATIGGLIAGKFRIGNTGGELTNVIDSKLVVSGSVGLVTRSGGLLNELFNIISKNSNGVYSGISIGGDRYVGTNFIDVLLNYEKNPHIKMTVLIGEVGGIQELWVCDAYKRGILTKPLVAWCIGTSSEALTSGNTNIQFGHAGACINSEYESANYKNAYMKTCGINVPDTFEQLPDLIKRVFNNLNILTDTRYNALNIKNTWHDLIKQRRDKTIFCSISDETAELKYNNIPVSELKLDIGNIIGHLWFKKQLSTGFTKYIQLILCLVADHGPCVSGALNTIITTRANKDLVSSLCSGLLTIGSEFGGAINQAAKNFFYALKNKTSVGDFIKQHGVISGYGHKYKTADDGDMRVTLLQNYVNDNLTCKYAIQYARQVESVLLKKRNTLILNVDGMIGCSIIDFLRGDNFTDMEIIDILQNDILNGLFVTGRTIGFIGHHIDQKRLRQGLYRHPHNSVGYLE